MWDVEHTLDQISLINNKCSCDRSKSFIDMVNAHREAYLKKVVYSNNTQKAVNI